MYPERKISSESGTVLIQYMALLLIIVSVLFAKAPVNNSNSAGDEPRSVSELISYSWLGSSAEITRAFLDGGSRTGGGL